MKKLMYGVIISIISLVDILILLSWERAPKDIALSAVETDFSEQFLTEDSKLSKGNALRLKKAFGLNVDDYAEVFYVYSEDMMSAEEMLLVKLKDESQKDSVKQAVAERLASRKKAFDGYGSDQMEILNHAVQYSTGKYVCYIVSKNDAAWLKLFKKHIWG